MNFFKSFTLLWWQGGIYKLAMVAVGIAIGATWPTALRRWRSLFMIVFALGAAYIGYVWWRQ